MSDSSATPAHAVRDLIRAAQASSGALARQLDLGRSDLAALEHLLTEGPLGPAELGDRLGLRRASATALVDRLEEAGHVRRTPHPADRRRLTVTATEQADQQAREVLGPLLAEIDAAADPLTDAERRVVIDYLDTVSRAFRNHS